MSMECQIGRLDASELEQLRKSPLALERLWLGSEASPPAIGAERRFHVGIRWSALNFLMTGTALEGEFPACFLVSAGEALEIDEDEGYGIANLVPPSEVAMIRKLLASLDIPSLFRDFDPQRMLEADVYLADLWLGDTDAAITELQTCLEDLRDFLVACNPSQGLLIECC